MRINWNVFSVAGLVFITLKLDGSIDWSWWYVLAPFYIPFVALGFTAMLIGAVALIYKIVEKTLTILGK